MQLGHEHPASIEAAQEYRPFHVSRGELQHFGVKDAKGKVWSWFETYEDALVWRHRIEGRA